MTTDILLKLLDAGYTKADIDRMEELEPKPTPAEPAQPDPEPSEPAEPAEPKKADPDDPAAASAKAIEDIMQIIGKMQKTLDGMQRKNAHEAEAGQPERITADKVIKDFFGERKKA